MPYLSREALTIKIIIYIYLKLIKKLIIMKKVLVLSAFAVFGVLALSSCKKDYTCDYGGGDTITYTGLTKAQAESTETVCKLGGGTWSKK